MAYLGVNAVEVFETFFATWLLGAIAVPLNYRLSGPRSATCSTTAGASVLVHSADTDALVAAAGPLPAGLRVLAVHPASCPAAGWTRGRDRGGPGARGGAAGARSTTPR